MTTRPTRERPRSWTALLLVPLALAPAGCAPAAATPLHLPAVALPGTDGAAHRLTDLARAAPFTVVLFFSADCACQQAHDARLREMSASYGPRGVQLVAVDSEAGSTLAADRAEALARGYPFPILSDPEGAAADALGATWATYAVVVDAAGRVHYRGGLDSDRIHLTEGASFWLRDALDRLLAGREPEAARTETLGCTLRRR